MTWSSFFKSRSFTQGSCAAATGFLVGTGGTIAIALKMASECSLAVDLCVSGVGQDINIPQVEAQLDIRNHSTSITFYDINVPLPSSLTDIVDQLNALPVYCFYAPFAIGMCLTIAISLSLASAIALAIHIKDQDEQVESRYKYSLLPST